MNRLLLDTDILINWIRGEKWEKDLLLTSGIDFYISQLSRKELFRYKKITVKEKKKILYLLHALREIPITSDIAKKTSDLLKKYANKPLKPVDALIAATAWDKNLVLISKNQKHFSFIEEIVLNKIDSPTAPKVARVTGIAKSAKNDDELLSDALTSKYR